MEATNNPFALAVRQSDSAMVESASARETSEVQAMMVIAKKFPRDQVAAMDSILQACARPSLAETSLYNYARGGTEISGPSIRLAEAIAQAWGNVQFGFREISRGIGPDKVGYSEVEAYAWDVQTNTRKPISFRVRHWRDTKKGGYALVDERDIYELVANQASRRVRNCILAIIPGDVTEAAQRQCDVTLKTHADTSPDAQKKLLAAFSEFGITREQIEKKIQRRIDTITPAQIVMFKKVYASLRDGMGTPADFFDIGEKESTPNGTVADKLNEKIGKKAAPPADPEAAADPIADLLLVIGEAKTLEELEVNSAAVANLTGEAKRRATEAWKAAKARIAEG